VINDVRGNGNVIMSIYMNISKETLVTRTGFWIQVPVRQRNGRL